MDLNFEEVYFDKIHFVKDLNGKIKIINNKVEEADILALYNNSQNIKFTIRTNDQGEKITTLFSSKVKPLVDRYKFIKGFKDDREGYLDFYSLKKDGVSTSKLVIDNFKENAKGSSLDLVWREQQVWEINWSMPGLFNARNLAFFRFGQFCP